MSVSRFASCPSCGGKLPAQVSKDKKSDNSWPCIDQAQKKIGMCTSQFQRNKAHQHLCSMVCNASRTEVSTRFDMPKAFEWKLVKLLSCTSVACNVSEAGDVEYTVWWAAAKRLVYTRRTPCMSKPQSQRSCESYLLKEMIADNHRKQRVLQPAMYEPTEQQHPTQSYSNFVKVCVVHPTHQCSHLKRFSARAYKIDIAHVWCRGGAYGLPSWVRCLPVKLQPSSITSLREVILTRASRSGPAVHFESRADTSGAGTAATIGVSSVARVFAVIWWVLKSNARPPNYQIS